MGTNYYAVRNRPSIQKPIHIGKSSWGWLFHFEEQNDTWCDPPVIWNTYKQVRDWLQEYVVDKKEFVIMDEEDEILSFEDFFEIVDEKQKDPHNLENPHNFDYGVKNVDGYRFSVGEFL